MMKVLTQISIVILFSVMASIASMFSMELVMMTIPVSVQVYQIGIGALFIAWLAVFSRIYFVWKNQEKEGKKDE
ncbi:MAG: hypothetical protein ACRC5Q_04945 [Culicoidibacterales bacterium]